MHTAHVCLHAVLRLIIVLVWPTQTFKGKLRQHAPLLGMH